MSAVKIQIICCRGYRSCRTRRKQNLQVSPEVSQSRLYAGRRTNGGCSSRAFLDASNPFVERESLPCLDTLNSSSMNERSDGDEPSGSMEDLR